VDVEIVEDQDDLLGVGVVDIDQVLDAVDPIIPPAVLGHLHMPLALQRLILPIELAMSVLPSGPILQRGFDSLGHRLLTKALDGGTADLDGLGDRGIRPLLTSVV